MIKVCGLWADRGGNKALPSNKAVTTHLLRQRKGIPYEIERVLCSECRHVLDEKQLRRAAA